MAPLPNARNDDIPCPLCGRWRSRRAMEQHIRQAHTPEGQEQAQRNGARSHGQAGKPWWKRLIERRTF